MKAEFTHLELPASVWRSLHRIDNLLEQPLSWEERLEKISSILIKALDVEAIWLLTMRPLPPTAYGFMHTPLAVAPDAHVQMIDRVPSFEENWPTPDSFLCQVLSKKQPHFIKPDETNGSTDADLGDVFFGTFNAIPAAIIPLVADETPLGALIIASEDPRKKTLSEDAQNLLAYLGAHLGTNLQNAYLLERARRHAEVLRGLNHIAQTITSSLKIDEVIQRTMAGINNTLDVEAGSLLLEDEDTGELYFAITLRGENKQITSYRLQPGEGIAGWVVDNNQPVISNNAQTDRRFTTKIDKAIGFITNNLLCVPLVVQGEPIGALEVLNKQRGNFNEDDQELLVSMSASLAIALKNADLYQEAQERIQRTEIITRITSTINTGHGLSETGKLLVEQFKQMLSFDFVGLSLLDSSHENIRQWILTEQGSVEYTQGIMPVKDSALAWIVEHNQGRIDGDISNHPDGKVFVDEQILLSENIKSKISFPLSTQIKPFGSLNIGHRQADAYGPSELRMLEQFMPQIAVAIEKSWLIDVMEQHNIELRSLNHLSEMLFSTTDYRLIVDTTVSMLPRLLPGEVQAIVIAEIEGVSVGLATPDNFRQAEQIIATSLNLYTELVDEKASTEIIYTKTVEGDTAVSRDWEATTVLHLPLLTRLGPVGIIYVASGKEEYIADDVWRTFSLIAAQISAAVENARLFQQVEQERARLAAILASSTDAVLVVNRKGFIVLDNPAAWQVMGVDESHRGKQLSESTDNKSLIKLFEGVIQGGEPTGEILVPDGRTFFANLSPVSVEETGVIGWVATMQDVSHFTELNQLKDEFVSTVSHDLRSPLAAILIATELVPQLGNIDQQQQELLGTIEGRVRSMHELIDDLLDVGKIEAGIDMEMEIIDLHPMVEEAMYLLKPHAISKSIQLVAELEDDLPPVLGNTIRIRQVIYNLTDNAIKYTPDKGRVTVKVFQQDGEVRIQITDTGIGIPATEQPHVFEKFHPVKHKYATNVDGTGLGLAITKGIIEKHNGRIWLESTPGEGSTFTVVLPIPQPDIA
jgi:PAS domain S-box-containing protein